MKKLFAPTQSNIPSSVISLVLMAIALYQVGFPFIANTLNRKGVKTLETGELAEAISYFKWSLKFDRHQPNALNNIGFVYEDLEEIELARAYYRQAKQLGSAAGCNNEARLDIESGNYDRAENLLRKCLKLTDSNIGQYSIQKNLGWALLAQDYYSEAEDVLQSAIEIMSDEGAANCLLAQVLEGQGEENEALPQWENCLENASNYYPDEVEWKRQASQRLMEVGQEKEDPSFQLPRLYVNGKSDSSSWR